MSGIIGYNFLTDKELSNSLSVKFKSMVYMLENFVKYAGTNFANPARIGGKISTTIMNLINQKQYKAVLNNIRLEQNNCILDIGFGNGYIIKKLIERGIPIKTYGIEISKDMLHKVELENIKSIQNKTLCLYLENINKTSFENSLFDKIYTVNTIYFWDNLDKCFFEIKRILKSDGLFLNVLYTKKYLDKIIYTKYGFNKYTLDDVKNITEDNGMDIIKIIEIQKNKSYCIISIKMK
jgi:SAM-dependent methyltransferase